MLLKSIIQKSSYRIDKSFTEKAHAYLLFKKLDTMQGIIKNFEDIIFKIKNFACLIWGGWLYHIAEHLNISVVYKKIYLFLITSLIPVLFWVMDYRRLKQILQCAKQQKIISLFMNSNTCKKKSTGKLSLLMRVLSFMFLLNIYNKNQFR